MESSMAYGTTTRRKSATQTWAVGASVRVGFLSLVVIGKTDGGWLLANAAGSKRFEFVPHLGLMAV